MRKSLACDSLNALLFGLPDKFISTYDCSVGVAQWWLFKCIGMLNGMCKSNWGAVCVSNH